MAPGPLTAASRGGFGFGHQHRGGNYGRVFSAPNTSRTYGTTYGPGSGAQQPQRLYLDDSGRGTLEAGDKLTVEIDDDGNTIVEVSGTDNSDMVEEVEEAVEPDNGTNGNGNGEEEESRSRAWSFGRRDKMAISSNSDGTVTIRPEGDASLQIVGDPLSGAITVIEVEPEVLNVVDGRY